MKFLPSWFQKKDRLNQDTGLSKEAARKMQSMQENIEHALVSNENLYRDEELIGILKSLCSRQLNRAVKNNEITRDEALCIAAYLKTGPLGNRTGDKGREIIGV